MAVLWRSWTRCYRQPHPALVGKGIHPLRLRSGTKGCLRGCSASFRKPAFIYLLSGSLSEDTEGQGEDGDGSPDCYGLIAQCFHLFPRAEMEGRWSLMWSRGEEGRCALFLLTGKCGGTCWVRRGLYSNLPPLFPSPDEVWTILMTQGGHYEAGCLPSLPWSTLP